MIEIISYRETDSEIEDRLKEHFRLPDGVESAELIRAAVAGIDSYPNDVLSLCALVDDLLCAWCGHAHVNPSCLLSLQDHKSPHQTMRDVRMSKKE